jgi:uncharacterized protein YndB with AHSA1/START domain
MADIYHELLIGAPLEKVYNAIVTQEGLAAWWTPKAKAKTEVDTIAVFPFGPDYTKEMRITSLKPSSQVKWICIKGAEEWVGTTISFELLPVDKETVVRTSPELSDQVQQLHNFRNGTLLVLHHNGWKDHTSMFAECNYTWAQFLRSLKLLCETGKGRPWPNQHRTDP